jgi:hypothetical protein
MNNETHGHRGLKGITSSEGLGMQRPECDSMLHYTYIFCLVLLFRDVPFFLVVVGGGGGQFRGTDSYYT